MIRWSLEEIAAGQGPGGLRLDDAGDPTDVLAVVDLSAPAGDTVVREAATRLARRPAAVLVGVATGTSTVPTPLEEVLDCTVTHAHAEGRYLVSVSDADEAIERIERSVMAAPRACVALAALLRQTAQLGTPAGLAAESATYSMLLAGPEFQAWRAARPRRPPPDPAAPPVVLDRDGETVRVELNRPHRHNAFDREMRDELVQAFDFVLADPTIERVEFRGRGPSFGSGGDLDEFGTAPDSSTAHLIRLDRSVGARIDRCRERVVSYLHGFCIGSGIELPAFGDDVVAAPGTVIRLPEIEMGLIPGAGGTVSITRRIGRWRTAYLALTGAPLDEGTALGWGLVDRIHE